ncbi:porin [Ralstonia insidiosa]|uniref:Porin n=1 Tax=Ralstonia insidiosa TaxID=190721 RepID=A0A848P7G8_9RALS|nr:porin [Ralstonia insidiosa]NMV41519.1 porin [Ralstonia insidiosa]
MSRTKFALAATAAAVATLAAPGAHAQASNVTLYGLIDTTISTVNNTNAAGARTTGFQVPWFSGSRWGLTGKEDLGGGTSAIFRLESEFETPTGNMDTPGVLFNRDAWVGLSSEALGKLTFGRQNAIARDISAIYGDPYTSEKVGLDEGGYTNVNNFKQLIFYAGSATGTRLNNGVVWKKLWDGRFLTALGYQFGEVPGQFSQGSTESLALGYNGDSFHLAGFAQQAKVNGFTDRSYSIGGNVIIDIFRINAGYFHYTGEQPAAIGNRSDNAYTVSLKIAPQGAFDYEIGYQIMKANNAAFDANGNTLNAYASVLGATASGSGRKSTLYGSVFYHVSKRTEFYVAADYMKLKDQYIVGSTNGHNSQTEFAIGMRTRF